MTMKCFVFAALVSISYSPVAGEENRFASTIKLIEIPRADQFSDVLNPDALAGIGDWMNDLSAQFETVNYDVVARGEYGRTADDRTMLNAVAFRIAKSVEKESRRLIVSEQSLLDNPAADFAIGAIVDNARRTDILFDDSKKTAVTNVGRTRFEAETVEVMRMHPMLWTFHPYRTR